MPRASAMFPAAESTRGAPVMGGDGHQDALNLLERHPRLHGRANVHQVRGGRSVNGDERADPHQQQRRARPGPRTRR
jgi:hypothetical protein